MGKPFDKGRAIRFGQISAVRTELIEVRDWGSQIFRLSMARTGVLQEWLLVPEDALGWSEGTLANATFNNMDDLIRECREGGVLHDRLTSTIAGIIIPKRIVGDYLWNISGQYLEGHGVVLSVVVGLPGMMEEVYKRGLREAPETEPEVGLMTV